MCSELKQDFDQQLSTLIREYEDRGLGHDEMDDSLAWHLELVRSRYNIEKDDPVRLVSD